ncbi:KAP family P-loop NTPase fold protein [Paenirhodobacter populi]|uniref:NTPase KAP n=1 Tax=Paenirhodobacter populi TaxID=2306993 RepID=A0A443IKS4_9RHOB|nr:P-loop NTPase fold protein [Sinirhodobacter populi]RWR05302.1 NTPase KAP [Sinirhodobacter populi]
MWSDSESRVDYLNYSEVSEMIAEIISNDAMLPTSIGVYGTWGVGKSSMLRLISQELADDRFVVVDFDAWLYQDFDEAKSALMTVIAKSLYAAAPEKYKDQAASFYRRVNKLKVMGIAMDLGALAMGVPTFGGITKGLGALGNIFRGHGDADDVGDVHEAVADGQEQFGGLLKEKEKRNPPEEIEAFREEFANLLETIDRRLVVFVDNLDRCLPGNTIATLEAMRLFLFLPKTAFIVAADEDMIRHSVSKHFSGPGDRHISDYLDKLINVPVRVPKLGLQEVRAYLFMLAASQGGLDISVVEELRIALIERLRRSWSDEPPITIEEVAAILKLPPNHAVLRNLDTMDLVASQLAYAERVQGNPRIVKRLLNVIRMRAAVARRRKMPLDEGLIAKLALFERCTDGEAIRSFGRLVNAAESGKVDLLANLEATLFDNDDAFEEQLPKEWQKHKAFIQDWLKLEPPLGGVDLRAVFYLSRETLPVQSASAGLTPTAIAALEVLRKTVSINSKASKTAIASVDLAEMGDLMDELCASMKRDLNWSKIRSDFRGAVLLAQASPEAHARLIRFVEALPKIPAWMAGLMRDKGQGE